MIYLETIEQKIHQQALKKLLLLIEYYQFWIQFLMIKLRMVLSLLLLMLCLPLNGQDNQQKTFSLHLQQNELKHYTIIVPAKQSNTTDMFIHAAPKYSDPFQSPYLTISSSNDYFKQCYSAATQFAGICHIGPEELIEGRAFNLEIKCATSCDLVVHIFQSVKAILQLGSNIKLTAYQQAGLTEIIYVAVPSNLSFTGLAVTAMILNLEENIEMGDQGVNLLLNYGKNVVDPEQNQFQLRGQSLNGAGKEAFIYSNQTSAGDIIKCMIKLKKGVSVRFSIVSMNNNQLDIDLGKSYFDYVNKDGPKIYTLNTKSYSLTESDKTLEIVFDIYSGNPEFLIAFDLNFTNPISYNRKLSAVSILLSPNIRKSVNFTDLIFIKVTSEYASEYYFYTNFIRDDVTFIEPYFSYLDQIPKDQVQNYILTQIHRFPEGNNNTIKNYSFKVEIIDGKGSFYFRRCTFLEKKSTDNPSFKQCLTNDAAYFKSTSFYAEEIQNKNILTGNLLTISMVYDISKCTEFNRSEGIVTVKCSFLISVVGESSQIFEFSLLPQRNYFINYLREKKVIKQYIPKGNYVYYAFSLPEIQSVSEINIFVTTLSGDTALIVSSTDRLPTLETNGIIKQSGIKNNIVLRKGNLTSELYISVYAYQFAEINIGVIVHRGNSNTSVHEIPLNEDNVQTYTLNKTQPIAYFKFNSKNATQISVFVNQLSGYVQIRVYNESGSEIDCRSSEANRLTCTFVPSANRYYTVKVTGNSKQENKFSITYKTQKTKCFSGKLNEPLYVSLSPSDTQCFSFNANRQISIIFVASFSHLQLFNKQIITTLLFNKQQFEVIEEWHRTITVKDMISTCPMGISLDGFPMTCELSIVFQNGVNSTNAFSFVMEEEDSEIVLFDGINQKVKGQSIQIGNSKNFYYPVTSSVLIQIFFTTRSLKSHYFLASKFVSKSQFLARNSAASNIYLPYVGEIDRPAPKVDMSGNYFWAMLGEVNLQRLAITSKDIQTNCPQLDCFLILSIYPENFEGSIGQDYDQYEIEVSQEETYIALGDSKIGMLNKGELYTYLVDPQDAILSFKIIDSNGMKNVCVSVNAALANGTIVKGNMFKNDLQVSKLEKIERIFVKGMRDYCSFEITYISNVHPYQSAQLSHPYDINLTSGQTVRLIYFHQSPRTFRIIQMQSAGDPSIFIIPIPQSSFTLTNLDSLNYSSFPTFPTYDGELAIESNSSNFCSNCYYYVIVTTKTKFVGQIVFLRFYDPIPLTTNHIFMQTLSPSTGRASQNFIYYSLTTFNLTFNILSGKIQLIVVDPEDNTVVQQEIIQKKTYNVKSLAYKNKQKVQYYSERSKFKIAVKSVTESQFYIELNRNRISSRIFQGYPTPLLIEAIMPQTIEFINSQSLDRPLSLMVDINELHKDEVLLTFTITAETPQGKIIESEELLQNITKSDNTYAIKLKNIEGRYFLAINTNVQVNVTLLLAKTALTYISPTRNYLFQEEGVYQVYSNNQNLLIEIFNCEGELQLVGSREEREVALDYTGKSAIEIKRPNYGGHYVFGIQADFPSYYVRVTNKFEGQPLEYLINYYYYEGVNPYEVVDTPNYDISFTVSEDGVHLSVHVPFLLEGILKKKEVEIKIKKITFIGHAATTKQDLNRNSRCQISGKAVQKSSQDASNIYLDSQILSKIWSGKPEEKLFITVQAQISVQMSGKNITSTPYFPNVLTIFYNTLQIAKNSIDTNITEASFQYWFTDDLLIFLGWLTIMVLLVLVAPYYIIKLFIRKLMIRQQSMAEEIEINEGHQTRPTEEKLGGDTNNPPPISSQPIIKEHI